MAYRNTEGLYKSFIPRRSLERFQMTPNKQGLVFYIMKNYMSSLNDEERIRCNKLIKSCCRGRPIYEQAVFLCLTSELSVSELQKEFPIKRSTFYVYLDDFYLNFNNYVKRVY